MITENNKIIAKFMGFEIKNKINYVPPSLPNCMKNAEHLKVDKSENLPFHNDWNWLMEVVEKIFSLDDYYHFKQTLGQFDTSIRDRFPNKEGVYTQCIEFIKWYNENSAKEK